MEKLVNLIDGPEWDVLEYLEEEYVRKGALSVLQTNDEINVMLRAQGTLQAFIYRDSVINNIYEKAKAEELELKEKMNE